MGYSKRKQQQQKKYQKNNLQRKSKALSEWADELNIPYSILADRIYKYKWNIERAMTEPYIAK